MILKQHTLREKVGLCGLSTLSAYLARPEYSHIKKIKFGSSVQYANVYPVDIEKLKVFSSRQGKSKVERKLVMAKYDYLCSLKKNAKPPFYNNFNKM